MPGRHLDDGIVHVGNPHLRAIEPNSTNLAPVQPRDEAGVVKLDVASPTAQRLEPGEVIHGDVAQHGCGEEIALAIAEWEAACRATVARRARLDATAKERGREPRDRAGPEKSVRHDVAGGCSRPHPARRRPS